jgi:S-(hydroxymethyl)glutathione dehydrogenase/alcohol dehydrogenase
VLGANAMVGCLPDGTFRFHADGEDLGGTCMLGTFSQRMIVSQHSLVKIDPWLPLRTAALAGCGVPTGWGSAVYAGGVRPGDITAVYGIGGVGINAVKGASMAGAAHVIAVDPVPFKRDMAKRFGATETFAAADEAKKRITELSWGQGADQAILTAGMVDAELVSSAVDTIGEGGTVVIVGLAKAGETNVCLSGNRLALADKTIRGSLFGSSNPQYDIVRLLRLYNSGHLPLDDLITHTYSLDDINIAVEDLRCGRSIRGIITFGE